MPDKKSHLEFIVPDLCFAVPRIWNMRNEQFPVFSPKHPFFSCLKFSCECKGKGERITVKYWGHLLPIISHLEIYPVDPYVFFHSMMIQLFVLLLCVLGSILFNDVLTSCFYYMHLFDLHRRICILGCSFYSGFHHSLFKM